MMNQLKLIGDVLSLPSILVRAQDWELGEIVAQFGLFGVRREAIVLRNGQHRINQYALIAGELPVPWHTPVWGESLKRALDRHHCVHLGAIKLHDESVTVVEVYQAIQQWLRLQQVAIDVNREPLKEDAYLTAMWEKAASHDEARVQIVREGLDALQREYGHALTEIKTNAAPSRRDARILRRVRRISRVTRRSTKTIQVCIGLLGLFVVKPIWWLYSLVRRLSKGHPEEVIAETATAIRVQYDYRRGVACLRRRAYRQAVTHFDRVIRLTPDYAEAYQYRGQVLINLNDYDRALVDLDTAIRLRPDDGAAYVFRGWIFLSRGDYERAIADFDTVIRWRPDYAEAYEYRGIAHSNQQEYEQARADFATELRLKPASTDARERHDEIDEGGEAL